jgi:hypothetical protein
MSVFSWFLRLPIFKRQHAWMLARSKQSAKQTLPDGNLPAEICQTADYRA